MLMCAPHARHLAQRLGPARTAHRNGDHAARPGRVKCEAALGGGRGIHYCADDGNRRKGRPVGTTQDRLQISDLVARYVEAVATADRTLFHSVWAADARWVVDGRGTFQGPDEITALFWRLRERQEFAVQRVVSGRAVIRQDRSASGRWIIHSLTRTRGEGAELVGVYDDQYAFESSSWKFRERAFTPLYRGPISLAGTVFAPPTLPPLDTD